MPSIGATGSGNRSDAWRNTGAKLNVGLIGLGRLGRVYARDLATRIACTRLVAVADVDRAAVDEVAARIRRAGSVRPIRRTCSTTRRWTPWSSSPRPRTHARGDRRRPPRRARPIFCEKPLAISLDEAVAMTAAVGGVGRLLPARVHAPVRSRLRRGQDAARRRRHRRRRWCSSRRRAIRSAVGGVRQPEEQRRHDPRHGHPRLRPGALVHGRGARPCRRSAACSPIPSSARSATSTTRSSAWCSRAAGSAWSISPGTASTATTSPPSCSAPQGTLRIGYLRETPLMVMTKSGVAHDTVPYFMERFGEAYTAQLENFAQNVLHGRQPPITIDDGVEALRMAVAATRARETGQRVERRRSECHLGVTHDQLGPTAAHTPVPQAPAPEHRSSVTPAARRVGIRRVRGSPDRPRRHLDRSDRRQRSVPGAALGPRVDHLVAGPAPNRRGSGRAATSSPTIRTRSICRRARAFEVRATRRDRDRRVPLADTRRLRGAGDQAGGLRAGSARRRQRHAPDHRHPAARRRRRIVCWCARS